MNIQLLLNHLRADFREILGENLVGFYVHGSIAFGCFTWATGDADFLAVAARQPSHDEKVALIRALLRRTPDAPPKGIEMSVVTEDACRRFIHPAPYELHFSNAHLDRCRSDPGLYCREMHGVDPDLAAHFAVTRAVGLNLYGPPAKELFAPVPREAMLDSLRRDIEDTDIFADPVYAALNLCRAAAFREDNLILSKEDGGRWALAHLPEKYHPAILSALARYAGKDAVLDKERLRMLREELLKRFRA